MQSAPCRNKGASRVAAKFYTYCVVIIMSLQYTIYIYIYIGESIFLSTLIRLSFVPFLLPLFRLQNLVLFLARSLRCNKYIEIKNDFYLVNNRGAPRSLQLYRNTLAIINKERTSFNFFILS